MYNFVEYLCMLGCAYFIISCAYDLFKWAQCKDLKDKKD